VEAEIRREVERAHDARRSYARARRNDHGSIAPELDRVVRMMKRICLALVFAVACSKGGGSGLSKANVDELKKDMRESGFKKTDEAVKTATDKLGAPTRTDGKKTIWAFKDGDKCREFYIEDMDGKGAFGEEGTSCPK
jgi:hypothetical protein